MPNGLANQVLTDQSTINLGKLAIFIIVCTVSIVLSSGGIYLSTLSNANAIRNNTENTLRTEQNLSRLAEDMQRLAVQLESLATQTSTYQESARERDSRIERRLDAL